RVLGASAIDRGRPQAWKVLTELLRTAVVAGVFAWIAARAELAALPGSLGLAALLWGGVPAGLVTGAVQWVRVPPVTAGVHAGDWLLKLVLIGVLVGLLH